MNWPWQITKRETKESLWQEVTRLIDQILTHPAGRTEATVQPTAFLGSDLGLSSIAVARLAGLLQKRYGGKPLPFHMLFVKPDGSMLQDIRIADLVSFLEWHLNSEHP